MFLSTYAPDYISLIEFKLLQTKVPLKDQYYAHCYLQCIYCNAYLYADDTTLYVKLQDSPVLDDLRTSLFDWKLALYFLKVILMIFGSWEIITIQKLIHLGAE